MSQQELPTAIVVNDEPTQLHLASMTLEQDGFQVIRCRGAEEALKVLSDRQRPVDIIVTDLHMPGIDGWRFCRLLRSPEYAPYDRVPVLVVSATFSGIDAEQITADLGANAFLPVPHEPATLRTCVRRLLRGEAAPSTLRVLLVESLGSQAILLRDAFHCRGWDVCVAGTIEDACRLYNLLRPDIIIVNSSLPDGTAETLLKRVRAPGDRTVVIVISTDSNPVSALVATRLGADGYVHMPSEPEFLITVCEQARRARALLRIEELLECRTRDLRESEERLRSLIEHIPEIILVRAASGEIRLISEASAQRLGWSANQLVGCSIETVLLMPEGQEAVAAQQSVFPLPQPIWKEANLVTRMGGHISAEVCTIPIMLDRKPALLEVVRDISERRRVEAERAQLEDRLCQAQKMEVIGQLAAGLAHDFNNLLSPILGQAHMFKIQATPGDPVYRGACFIETAVQHARRLTEQLLDVARPRKRQTVFFDLHATIKEVFVLLSRTVDKRIAFHQDLCLEEAVITGDPGQLHQVLMNLALNACDAMPEGGNITCRTEMLAADTNLLRRFPNMGSRCLRVSMSDEGCGIPKEFHARVFEPFFTTKESCKGSGMGLAMVYGIVASHGGHIELESGIGKGTQFHLYLPLTERHADTGSLRHLDVSQRRQATLLVVEDDTLVREVIVSMLHELGHRVVTAGSGIEAIELYQRKSSEIALVILDISLPFMSGLESFRALRQINPEIRAVLSSGYEPDFAVQEMVNEGICGFVQKPFEFGQLSQAVTRALEEKVIRGV